MLKFRFHSYFLYLDIKKVSKEKSRLKIFLGEASLSQRCALQLARQNNAPDKQQLSIMPGSDSNAGKVLRFC
jgi:hypothetical protein